MESKQADLEDKIEKCLATLEKAKKEQGVLELIMAHAVFVGYGGSGKSSLINRLLGKVFVDNLSSTGVAENVIQVGIKEPSLAPEDEAEDVIHVRKKESTLTSVYLSDSDLSEWQILEFDNEATRLIKRLLSIFHTQDEASTSQMETQSPQSPHAPTHVELTVDESFSHSSGTSMSSPLHDTGPPELYQETMIDSDIPRTDNVALSILADPGYQDPSKLIKNVLESDEQILLHTIDYLRKELKKSLTLNLSDTGGQMEFQELLPLLVSGPSIFFVTFRLNDNLNKIVKMQYRCESSKSGSNPDSYDSSFTVKESIMHTLASIASMSKEGLTYEGYCRKEVELKPQVFIVGTHRDKLVEAEAESKINEINESLRDAIEHTDYYKQDHVEFHFATKRKPVFTVNNKSIDSPDFQMIRERVNKLIRENSQFMLSLPSKWLIFSLVLRQEFMKNLGIVSYDQCDAIAQNCGIEPADTKYVLLFLHQQAGLIRHFSCLNDTVFLKPQILFNMVTKLIVETFTWGENRQREFKEKGIFSKDDFLSLFGKHLPSSMDSEKFLYLLKHLLIVAEFHDPVGGKPKYFIPCVLPHCKESNAPDSVNKIPPLLITFKCGYCPKGLSGALIAYLLSNSNGWKLSEDKIHRNQVTFMLLHEGQEVTIMLRVQYLEICFILHEADTCTQDKRNVCIKVREEIEKGILHVHNKMKLTEHAEHFLTFFCNYSTENDTCTEQKHPAEIIRKEGKVDCLICHNLISHDRIKFLNFPKYYDLWFNEDELQSTMQHGTKQDAAENSGLSSIASSVPIDEKESQIIGIIAYK